MNKEIIKVPKGIRYMSEWKGFNLPDYPVIIDKKLTGCGFTEWILRNESNTILLSPRKILLENKEEQHNQGVKEEFKPLYYAKCSLDKDIPIDKDFSSKSTGGSKKDIKFDINQYYKDLENAISNFILHKKPIKILVTYDSFRKVKEILQKRGILKSFYCVVDEFQSIFSDSNFKPNTELELVNDLQGIQRICYVSATPMIEDSLDKLNEFKNLPYWELDWKSEDPSRIHIPTVIPNSCKNINTIAKKYITDFNAGKYLMKTLTDDLGNPIKTVEAKELVFYVNSVKNIASIIKQNNLTIDQVNIICADTPDNRRKIRDAFKYVYEKEKKGIIPKLSEVIGKVPIPDPKTGVYKNKPITFCTKTVYLGSDMYSKCARTIVLSDANVDSLTVDIRLDLQQILGRQRDDENPWKFYAEFWYKTGTGANDISPEEFKMKVDKKMKRSDDLIQSWEEVSTPSRKHALAETYLTVATICNYKDDYVGVNCHAGSDLKPQINMIVLVSEERAYKIQNMDYKDQFSVFNTLKEVFKESENDFNKLSNINTDLNKFNTFVLKMKKCCELVNNGEDIKYIPDPFKSYILALGVDVIISLSCQKSKLDKALQQTNSSEKIYTVGEISERIQLEFEEGQRYTNIYIKEKLRDLYKELNIPSNPKATDIENWFEVKICKIQNKKTGKRDFGFEIISKK